MTNHLGKVLVAWNVLLTALLLIALASNASLIQAANDPPVRAYTANSDDVAAGGGTKTSNQTIDGTNPEELVRVTTSKLSPDHPHTCIVIASAQADYAGNGNYIFGISSDGLEAAEPSERRIELFDNPSVRDDSYEEVSSVYIYLNVTGSHDFRFTARKGSAASGNMVVDAATIGVICVKKSINL